MEGGSVTTVTLGCVAKGIVTTGIGDSGGVESRKAFSSTSGGGRERGEKMMPGARDGFDGRRDQMAQPPTSGFALDDALCGIVADAEAAIGGTDTWGVEGSDREAWLEREGERDGGRASGDEGEEADVGSFAEDSGEES